MRSIVKRGRSGAARAWLLALVLGAIATFATGRQLAWAVQPDEVLQDSRLEARARTISAELRCLVCQNQSIDDSDAPLARDLRLLVREKLTQGATNDQVIDFLVDRYGEFVLLRPSFSLHNAVLWLGPFAILLAGGVVVWASARRRRPKAAPGGLSVSERTALDDVLGGRGEH